MTRRSHAGAWLMLWLVLAIVGPLGGGPEGMATRFEAEIAAVHAGFGPRLAARVLDVADTQAHRRQGGPAQLAGHPLAARIARVATAFQLQAATVALRAASLATWWILLLPLVMAAVVDGFVQRAVKADTFGYQNPAAFSVAGHGLIAVCMVGAVGLVMPFPMPSHWMPVSVLAALAPLRVTLSHLQPVFTR